MSTSLALSDFDLTHDDPFALVDVVAPSSSLAPSLAAAAFGALAEVAPPMMAQRQLQIVNQSSLTKQEIHQNNEHVWLHVVVKNSPFDVALRLADGASFDHVKIGVTLHYHATAALVPHPKGEAVTFDAPELDSASELVLRVRLHALSSKHEKMNFCLKISLLDQATNTPLGVPVFSAPIKCVSKPDQAIRCATPAVKAVAPARRVGAHNNKNSKVINDDDDDDDEFVAGDDDGSASAAELETNDVARARSVATKRGAASAAANNNKRRRGGDQKAPGTAWLSGVGAAEALATLLAQQQALSDKLDQLLNIFVQQTVVKKEPTH